jgi:seryl-tRNA synthetase
MEHSPLNISLGESPNSFDVAIAPIDSYGTLGPLNSIVLNSFGYELGEVSSDELKKGFTLLKQKNLKPVLLIVTVDKGRTGSNLEKNLFYAIESNLDILRNKRVWVPLLGTGAGKLDLRRSYEIISNILHEFSNDVSFTISIPDEKRGEDFLKNVLKRKVTDNKKFELENKNQPESKTIPPSPPPPPGLTNDTKFDISLLKNELGNINYFVAGHIWNNEDQLPRFIENEVWENGHRDNDVNAVNSVNNGDLIFIKSTFAQNGISYLRLKAFGIAVNNYNNGHNLDVVWHVLDKHIDIENLGKYRRTFAKVNKKDIDIILENIVINVPEFFDILNQLLDRSASKIEIPNEPIVTKEKEVINSITIAGLISDTDSGTDYLDISKDVNAFAKVMSAKSFRPPLAIALLGKWGSGKSFFMRKLMERIQVLSKSENQNAYCNGIAHVHFNAWSYMDSNLWASIITKIFEGLQEYITNDTSAKAHKKEIEKTLTKKLNIANEEIADLEHQKDSIDNKIKVLESQKGQVETALQTKIDDIKRKSIKKVINKLDDSFNISAKISDALASNDSFNKSSERFSEIVPKEYWQNPSELYKKTKSAYTYVKTFFKGSNWKTSLAWFCLIVIFVISMKAIVLVGAKLLEITDFTFPTKAWYLITIIGGFIVRNIQTYKHLQPLISTFWNIKEDYELQKKDAIFKIQQEEKALKYEIENFKTEIQSINKQINQAKQSKLEIEYRLENTLTTEALFNFIKKRSDSDDYKKHLGIVSVIRKDFEILSELFSGHHDELNNSGESEEFQKQFDKPLERIILYIDDLDRCSDERVVQVLEAVNLLMAYPLFVVVVGVDPRWVKNALVKKHQLQFNNNGQQKENAEMIEPSSYLEKIFQVPFQLKSANDESVKHMLKTLAESQPAIDEINDNLIYDEEGEVAGYDDGKDEEFNEDVATQAPIVKEVLIKEEIESLKFSDKELELLQTMSPILGTNPRALKRFVNIYRVIKAHEDFNYSNESEDGELLVVMFLIALPLGKYRKLVKPFEKYVNNDLTDGNLAGFETSNTEQYIIEHARNPGSEKYPLEPLRLELLRVLQINQNYTLLDQKKEIFRKHNPFIKRFTFNNL